MDITKTPYEFDNDDIIFIILSYYYVQYTFFNYPKVKICEFLGYNLNLKTSANKICGCISKKQFDFLLFVFTYGEKYTNNQNIPKSEQIEFQCCVSSGFSGLEPNTNLFGYTDMDDDDRIVDIIKKNEHYRKCLSYDYYNGFVNKMINSGITMDIAMMNIFCIYLHINKNNNIDIFKFFEVIRNKNRNMGEVKKYKQYLYKACFLYHDCLKSSGINDKIDSSYVINYIDKYISGIENRCHDESTVYNTFTDAYTI